MKQPKFRGFSKGTNKWHYGHGWFEIDYTDDFLKEKGIRPQAMLYTESSPIECDLMSMGQYTGLKDRNGKEIYEGDVVEYEDVSGGLRLFSEQPKSIGIIKWRDDGTGYQLKGMGFSIKGNKVEVIGNIYENPDLLK